MTTVSIQHAARKTRPPAVSTREQAVAGWRADARRRMGVGERHAIRRQAIEVWRWNPRARIERADVPVPKVVRQNGIGFIYLTVLVMNN